MSAPAIGLPGASAQLSEQLNAGLAQVEERLREVVANDDDFINSASRHLLDAGGKRFRPMLTILASQLGEGANAQVVDAAASVELIHMASLCHDDVMDEADLRRGVATANARYGNSAAILIGDLLFGRASELVAGLGAEAVRIQAQAFVRLCSGQIRDDAQAPEGADRMEHYLGVLADKTGSLVATALRYGAMFSGCDRNTIELLAEYGELLGLVFQFADDILDVTSDAQVSGKTPGTDLREGVLTLPVFYVQSSSDPRDARLQELVSRPVTDEREHAEALALLRSHKAIQQAQEHTDAVARQAVELLTPLGESDALTMLRNLPAAVSGRNV